MVRRNPAIRRQSVRRAPIQEQRGARVSRDRMLPAPVDGWNARDALSMMKETDAVTLINWFPTQSNLVTRPGFSEHCDLSNDIAANSAIDQLIPYEYAATSKLLAAANGGIFDVTSSTPSTLAAASTYTGNDWSFDYLTGYAILANGVDSVQVFNGTALSTSTFTGVTLANLDHVHAYKSRLYFVEKNSTSMWYGGVGVPGATGTPALTEFDFATVANIEGNLVFTCHLKGDGGDGGQDDLFVAVFGGGDVLAYSGSNPSDPTDWALVGHYNIGRPLSRLSYVQADDDVYVLTLRGYERLGVVVSLGDSAPNRKMLSDRIQKAVTDQIQSLGENVDWRAIMYQRGQMFIVTVPSAARKYHVMNINTGRWCEFRSFNAASWGVWEGAAYFGHLSDGKVYAFDDGSATDAGTTIRADAQPAWSYMGAGSRGKHVKLIRPFFYAPYFPATSINVGSNYDDIPLTTFSTATASSAAVWDSALWDVTMWAAAAESQTRWFSRNAIGSVIGLRVTIDVNSTGGRVEWNNTQILFETGGFIV